MLPTQVMCCLGVDLGNLTKDTLLYRQIWLFLDYKVKKVLISDTSHNLYLS